MNSLTRLFLTLSVVFCAAIHPRAFAPDLGGLGLGDKLITDQTSSLAALLSEFLSDSRTFTARAELQVSGGTDTDAVKLPFNVSMLEGRSRWDLDLARASGVDEDAGDLLKQMKLSRIFLIVQPERMQVIFPDAAAYADLPPPTVNNVQDKADKKIGRLQKTLLGKETVNGLVCMKYKLTVPDDKGGAESAVVWQAEKLNNLPVKFQAKQEGRTTTLQLFDVRLNKPDPKVFEVPAKFTKHASIESLMQATVLKSLGSFSGQ